MPSVQTSTRRKKAAKRGFPRTVERAKWIESLDEHEDRPGQTLATQAHAVIKRWARLRGGRPATVRGSVYGGRPGVLRLDFGNKEGGDLIRTTWPKWFQSFDERELVFLYQERMRAGNDSNFFRLVAPKTRKGSDPKGV